MLHWIKTLNAGRPCDLLTVEVLVCLSSLRPVVCAPRRLCAPSFVRPVVCAPRRLCAPSFLPLMASLMLAAPNVHAGTFVWKTTDANGNITAQSPVYSGGSTGGGDNGPNSSVTPAPFTSNSYYVGNAGYAGYSSGGCNADAQGHATSVTMTASGPLTATFTWQPASPGEAPPASVITYQDCRAVLTVNRYYGICGGSSVCTDGLGGSATLPFSGMQAATESHKYSLKMVAPDGTVSVSCSPNAVYNMSCYPTSGSYAAGAASVSYTASIVNGNWDGPYYFHNGDKDDGVSDTPWANNTAGPKPSITDPFDNVHSFNVPHSRGGQAYLKGSITPVWFWNGPDLGAAPPSFEITVSTDADSYDNIGNPSATYELDGIDDNAHDVGSFGAADYGSESVAVQVQSDVYAPGEGNGYWAIGPTVDLYSSIFGDTPSDLDSSVDLDASIESGLN